MNNSNFNNGYNNYNNPYINQQFGGFDAEYYEKKAQKENLSQKCMIFGIIAAAALVFCPCFPSIIMGIISLYYYRSARKILPEEKNNGQLTAGLVCSIISIVICALMLMLFFLYFGILFMYGFLQGASAA